MTPKTALTLVLLISLGGMAFSGYLSYGELFQGSCPVSGGCSSVLGLPACVYGFVMYLLVSIVCILGLKEKKK
ncbi:MAG: hypothetical protein AABX04_00330 [Nanoarchaeota archaeon]